MKKILFVVQALGIDDDQIEKIRLSAKCAGFTPFFLFFPETLPTLDSAKSKNLIKSPNLFLRTKFVLQLRKTCEKYEISSGDYIFFCNPLKNYLSCIVLFLKWCSWKKIYTVAHFEEYIESFAHFSIWKKILEKEAFSQYCSLTAENRDVAERFAKDLAFPMRYIKYGSSLFEAMHSDFAWIVLGKREQKKHELKKILVNYPWNNVKDNPAGSTSRLNLFLSYIRSSVSDITLLSQKQACDLDINMISYSHQSSIVEDILSSLNKCISGRRGYQDFNKIKRYMTLGRSHDYRIALTRSLIDCDVIFTEHLYDIKVITKFARHLDIPICVTLHDLDSRHCRLFFIKKLMDKIVRKYSPQCTMVATVEKSEHLYLKNRLRVENILIPTTLDIRQKVERKKKTDEFNVIFVGGPHQANKIAASLIQQFTLDHRITNSNVKFHIVGACGEGLHSNDALVVHGVVDKQKLNALYAMTDLAIAPIGLGTGAAVKTLEAMGLGIPLMGTSIAFRGLDVTDGKNCFIENDPSRYIDRIMLLKKSQDLLDSVSKAEIELASEYDFRKVFSPYINFIELN